VEASAVNTSCVRLRWQAPPQRQRNGQIVGYRVIYALDHPPSTSSDPPRDATTLMMTGTDRSCLIAGLATWTVYRVWISALTRVGEGPHSDMIVVQTDEGGTSAAETKCCLLPAIKYSGQTVVVGYRFCNQSGGLA